MCGGIGGKYGDVVVLSNRVGEQADYDGDVEHLGLAVANEQRQYRASEGCVASRAALLRAASSPAASLPAASSPAALLRAESERATADATAVVEVPSPLPSSLHFQFYSLPLTFLPLLFSDGEGSLGGRDCGNAHRHR